jgi:hypothetical protein
VSLRIQVLGQESFTLGDTPLKLSSQSKRLLALLLGGQRTVLSDGRLRFTVPCDLIQRVLIPNPNTIVKMGRRVLTTADRQV